MAGPKTPCDSHLHFIGLGGSLLHEVLEQALRVAAGYVALLGCLVRLGYPFRNVVKSFP